jgi:hypothetical protein
MRATVERLQQFLDKGLVVIPTIDPEELCYKSQPAKWSKKEILGHLIDSAVNNLRRFTEIRFESKPCKVQKYNQDQLVIANDYQHAEIAELLSVWHALNQRIIKVMLNQTEETLAYQIILGDGQLRDLRFLMVDYVDHLEYHLKQVFG